MQIEIRALTFGGFYGGLWDQGDNEYDAAQLEDALDVVQLKDEWGFDQDYREKVAEIYAQWYVDMVNQILGVDFKIISQEISSPREYNFETDKIFIKVEVGDYKALVDKLIKLGSNSTYRAELDNIIYDNHTSRDGFWSYMSNDIGEWFAFMHDPDDAHYTSFFIAYLMSVMDPELYNNLDDDIYDYICTSTDLHMIHPATDEANEEYGLYLEHPEAYAAFVEGPGANRLHGYCPSQKEWAKYKADFKSFLAECIFEKKRKEAIINHPVIPGLECN